MNTPYMMPSGVPTHRLDTMKTFKGKLQEVPRTSRHPSSCDKNERKPSEAEAAGDFASSGRGTGLPPAEVAEPSGGHPQVSLEGTQ